MSPFSHSPSLSARSANIPRLAIRAANELDEVSRGNTPAGNATQELAEILLQSVKRSTTPGIKSGTVAVFVNAIEEIQDAPKLTSYDQLISTAERYAKELEASRPDYSATNLEQLKLFCIALSRAASSYRRPVFEKEPHPFRK